MATSNPTVPEPTAAPALPTEINIGGIIYKVIFREIDGLYYNLDNSTFELEIDSKGSVERRAKTTFTGIIWTALYEFGMNNAGTDPDKVLNEHLLRNLYALIRDNDFTWLSKSDSSAVETVYIGGATYTLKRRKQDGLYGTCDYSSTLITLDNNGNLPRMAKTLLHEIFHAWLYEIGYAGHNDEKVITRLTVNFFNLFRENDFSWVRSEAVKPTSLPVAKAKLAPAA